MLQAANYTKGLKIKAEKHPRKTQGRFPANWNGTNWQSVQDSIPKVLKIWSSNAWVWPVASANTAMVNNFDFFQEASSRKI